MKQKVVQKGKQTNLAPVSALVIFGIIVAWFQQAYLKNRACPVQEPHEIVKWHIDDPSESGSAWRALASMPGFVYVEREYEPNFSTP